MKARCETEVWPPQLTLTMFCLCSLHTWRPETRQKATWTRCALQKWQWKKYLISDCYIPPMILNVGCEDLSRYVGIPCKLDCEGRDWRECMKLVVLILGTLIKTSRLEGLKLVQIWTTGVEPRSDLNVLVQHWTQGLGAWNTFFDGYQPPILPLQFCGTWSNENHGYTSITCLELQREGLAKV